MERRVLVTGATSGIGLETALELARLGFRTIGSARTQERAEALHRRAAVDGVAIDTVLLDLADQRAGDEVIADLGLWGLVNNAGYMNVGTIEDVPVATAREQLEAMVVAPVRLIQLALPGMRRAGEGRIVNVSSSAAYAAGPMIGWYNAAKHALSALTDALRIELGPAGVDVVEVEPGGHRSNIWSKAEDDLLSRRAGSRYGDAYERALGIVRALRPEMPSARNVARVVGEAMTAGQPRPRYRVGADAAVLDVADALLPTSTKDRLTRAVLHL